MKAKIIPFKPIPTNKHKHQQWLLEYFRSSAFNICPHQPLQTMEGKPLNIEFILGAKPTAVHTPIPVPHHRKKRVNEELDRDVAQGIIEPVRVGTPTTWCSRMVAAPKKDGSPRRTVDLQKLNDATMRETHHTSSPSNQVSMIPAPTRKTVLGAWNRYHCLPLSSAVRNPTTLITEWSRYRYFRASQGFYGSGDGYTSWFDDVTVDINRKTRCIDDSLLWDDSIEFLFWHMVEYISHCAYKGILFNPDKFHFAEREVEFAGFLVTDNGVKDDRSYSPFPYTYEYHRRRVLVWNRESFSQAEVKEEGGLYASLATERKESLITEHVESILSAVAVSSS